MESFKLVTDENLENSETETTNRNSLEDFIFIFYIYIFVWVIEFFTPKLVPMPIFNILVRFLQRLLTFGTFWTTGEPCDVTGGAWF